jgi:Zn-dependent alcohol dehydrogenase
MKAAILINNKKPLVVAELELPKTLEYGQVLVKVFYSGLCGAQLNEIDGTKGKDKFLPHLLGHEGSGLVLNTGPGVTTVKKRDHVVLHWRPSTGIQSPTPKYKWGNKTINAGWITTFNNQAVISENRLTKIPKSFDLKIAPLFGCAMTTAMGVVNNDAKVKIGESVVIFGLGGVGLAICQTASLVSAYPLVGVDLYKNKINLAKKFGMSHGFIHDFKKIDKSIKKIVGEKGADVVIDTTGNTRVIEQCYRLTHPDGKTILCGVTKKNHNVSIYTLPLHFKKVFKGSHGGDSKPDVDIPRFIRLLNSKKMNLSKIITHEYSLDNINRAIKTLRSGKAGRIIIKMD